MSYDFTLGHGAGKTPKEACFMQRAALMHAERHGYLDRLPLEQVLTDRPCWANQTLTLIAICCNDWADDDTRQRLRPLLERVLLATRKSPEVERRIDARLLCQQARKVFHLIPEEHREVWERSIATREAWLRGEATEDDCMKAADAAWAAGAAGAAGAARAAGAAGEFDPVNWLDDALDAWEKAAAEEGVLADDTEADRLVAEFVQAGGS